jgi:ferrous iron transport protein B
MEPKVSSAISSGEKTFIAVVGNPNTGKSTLFNSLTGMNQRIGNYPGVTVERKLGQMDYKDQTLCLVDLPGLYGLSAQSLDEKIVVDLLLGKRKEKISGILVIVDAATLERNLYLFSQLLAFEKPMILALNMIDIAEKQGILIQADRLSQRLGVPVIPIQANSGVGLEALKEELYRLSTGKIPAPVYGEEEALRFPYQALLENLYQSSAVQNASEKIHKIELERAFLEPESAYEEQILKVLGKEFRFELEKARSQVQDQSLSLMKTEAQARYHWINERLQGLIEKSALEKKTFTEKVDQVLLHPLWGIFFFFLLMSLIFQSIYTWAEPFMGGIEATFSFLGETLSGYLPEGPLKSLVVDGVIAGLGGVFVFLPQILFLFIFIALLEDCGYLARAAFLIDRLMSRFGLSGKAFVPMFSSFACAIPGIMATRVIEDRRERLLTILIAPLMSCSARLPVYVLLIAAFIPERQYLGGVFHLQGLVLLGAYFIGIFVAPLVAFLLKRTLLRGGESSFVLELPSYKVPNLRNIVMRLYETAREFLHRAGSIIFAVALLIWALAYYPRFPDLEKSL